MTKKKNPVDDSIGRTETVSKILKPGQRSGKTRSKAPQTTRPALAPLTSQTQSHIVEKGVDTVVTPPVSSSSVESTPGNFAHDKDTPMDLTLTKSTKERKSTSVVYLSDSLRGSVRFAKTFFKNGVAPDTIVVSSELFAEAKVKMTAEERKAARKNAPKLSPAEKLAKLQERAAKLQNKIDAAAAPVENV